MKLLITGGGTREPIDGVRFITNFSTGGTAAGLADFFTERGSTVTYLHGRGAVLPRLSCRNLEYTTFSDLNQSLISVLAEESFDAVLHLAAVSDYSVSSIEASGKVFAPTDSGKLPSREEITIKLSPNFKIVDRIKSYVRLEMPVLIAFKLTHTLDESERLARVRTLSGNTDIDLVVHNDLGDRNQGRTVFTLYRDSEPFAKAHTLTELGGELAEFIDAHRRN
jgi:phosphopantothenoylcysteine decarboxylase/phosphopantothenate--cysteine ligase